jgi:hypothetical protein
LNASIGEFRRAFPAAEVAFGVPDGHGDFARVSWVTRWRDGRAALAGEDFAQFGADGRIILLVSFDGTPALPGAYARHNAAADRQEAARTETWICAREPPVQEPRTPRVIGDQVPAFAARVSQGCRCP